MHIASYENKELNFIIGGATQASIRRNVLDDMELILGKERVVLHQLEHFSMKVQHYMTHLLKKFFLGVVIKVQEF